VSIVNSNNNEADLDDDVRVDPREWPDSVRAPWRTQRRGDRIVASLFVLWLIPNTIDAIRLGRPISLVLLLSLLYAGCYLPVWWIVPDWSPRSRVAWVILLYVFGIGYYVVIGPAGSLSVLSFALSAAIMLLPMAIARRIGLSTIGGALLVNSLTQHHLVWADSLVLALVMVSVFSLTQMARTVGKLRAARSEIRTLAVANERARLSRDLHDVLGHSLTTITVKTALARRLLESGADVARVREELLDTEELSRRTLADIRSTVSGQRRMSLAVELVSARAALRAAGIEADLPHAVDDVEARLEEPLAYVLREGVTNVVRHSGARRCTVRLGPRWLEVVDDGWADNTVTDSGTSGNGLTGLRERLAAVHGTIEAGPLPGNGFRLRAEASR
jgi:two-component system sensor histidine kinase DesK